MTPRAYIVSILSERPKREYVSVVVAWHPRQVLEDQVNVAEPRTSRKTRKPCGSCVPAADAEFACTKAKWAAAIHNELNVNRATISYYFNRANLPAVKKGRGFVHFCIVGANRGKLLKSSTSSIRSIPCIL